MGPPLAGANMPPQTRVQGYANSADPFPDEVTRLWWEIREWHATGKGHAEMAIFTGVDPTKVDETFDATLVGDAFGWSPDPEHTTGTSVSTSPNWLDPNPSAVTAVTGPDDLKEMTSDSGKLFTIVWYEKKYYLRFPQTHNPDGAVTPSSSCSDLDGLPLPASSSALTGSRSDAVAHAEWAITPSGNRIGQIRFWVNVFIPSSGDSIVSWPNQAGKTVVRALALPTPSPVRLFATDQRSFSPSLTASARVHAHFDLWLGTADYAQQTGQGLELTEMVVSVGETQEVSGSGQVIGTGTAVAGPVVVGPPTLAAGVWTIPVDLAAADPLVSGAPKVGITGEVTLECRPDGSVDVSCGANIDHWPAYEMYAQSVAPMGPPIPLAQVEPDTGSNVFDLVSPRDKWITGKVNLAP